LFVSATVPFRLWIEAGCPAFFDWDGKLVEAEEALLHEYDAIAETGPQRLEGWECEKLSLPLGSTNAEAHAKLRLIWPLK
jgi:hypothetical protein